MATQTGILQALWAEVRPAVEARDPSAAGVLARLVNRGKCAEALAAMRAILEMPAGNELQALAWIARRLGLPAEAAGGRAPAELRERIWQRLSSAPLPSLLNCRLLLDEPMPDRVWLHRHGSWIFYAWEGGRFQGRPLDRVRRAAGRDTRLASAFLLQVSVNGRLYLNPKLPPG